MVRKAAILVTLIVIAWWVRDSDPQHLKRDLIELRDNQTHFAPDDSASRSDWGG